MNPISRFLFGTLVIVASCTVPEPSGVGDDPEMDPQGVIIRPLNSEMKKTGGIDNPTQAGCMWRYPQGSCNQTPNQVFGDSCSDSTTLLEMVPRNGNVDCAEGACCPGYVQKVYDCAARDCGSAQGQCVTVQDACTLAGAGGSGGAGGGGGYGGGGSSSSSSSGGYYGDGGL